MLTGQNVGEYEISNSQANRIVVSKTEPKFAIGGYSTISLYDFGSNNNKYDQILTGHDGNVTDLIYFDSTLYSCGEDKTIKIWDKRDPKNHNTVIADSQLNSLVLFPNKNNIVVCNENGCIQMYDPRSSVSKPVKTESLANVPVRSLSMAPNGTFFTAVTQNGNAFIYGIDGENFTKQSTFTAHSEVTTLRTVVSPDSKLVATSAADGTARLFNVSNGTPHLTLKTQAKHEWIWDVGFSPDSTRIATCGSDCTCKIWDELGRLNITCDSVGKCISTLAVIST